MVVLLIRGLSIKMQLLKTDDGSYTLIYPDHQETYHSKFGALTETDQVFLRNSGVHQRLAQRQPTAILEIGFGTGFNFLRTANHAISCNCPLNYTAYEIAPVSKSIALKVLNHNAPDNPDLCKFTANTIGCIASGETEVVTSFNDQTRLHLIRADAATHSLPPISCDAIYLDAFSEKNNPSLWNSGFLEKLHAVAGPATTLATYCVNGKFRKALIEAGFEWQKLPGPAGKREVLIAKPAAATAPESE